MAQQSNRKSVRVLLAVGAPLVVAVAGVSVGLAGGSAQADNGNPVILGGTCSGTGTNCATGSTAIENTGTGEAFIATADNGAAGLRGFNFTGASTTGGEAAGVWGVGDGAGDDGVYGAGDANGVHGETANGSASGVYGQNDSTGFGVAGRANTGTGVLGDSSNGVGVLANSVNGTALQVTGTAQFSRSGVATVAGTTAAPKNSVLVPLSLTGKSMMMALLQKHVPGVYVVAAVPNASGTAFTIYLNKAVTSSVGPIAWIVTEMP